MRFYRSSAIFNAKQQALKTIEAKAAQEKGDSSEASDQELEQFEAFDREKVDLTLEQTAVKDDEGEDDMDDFDLLDATIDPTDVKSLDRRNELEADIEYEQYKIMAKTAWKLAFREDNPLKIDE